MRIHPRSRQLKRLAQRGVSLIFALIALVVLSLGAVALLRSVDSGLLALGNLGFKQDSLSAGSAGTEAAISWLQTNAGATLNSDQLPLGYSSVAMPNLDATGSSISTSVANLVLVDWAGNSCTVAGINSRPVVCMPASTPITTSNGDTVQYVITRLCASSGAQDNTNDCLTPVVAETTSDTSQRGSLGYGGGARFTSQSLGTYFRIITRTAGVRGTVSYTETLVHF